MRRYFLNAARSKNKTNNDFAYKPKGCRSDRRFYPVDCRPKDGKPVLSRRYSRSSGLRPLPVSLRLKSAKKVHHCFRFLGLTSEGEVMGN
nr:hypothetical protein [Providencia rettgeri]